MKKILFLFAVVCLFFMACTKEQQLKKDKSYTDQPTAAASSQAASIDKDVFTYSSDWSGKVQIVIVSRSESGTHVFTDVTVPPDYVLIGGGAVATYPQGSYGALLTASYPDNNLSTWHAASKDHIQSASHTLTGYAIGLKLSGVTKDELKTYIQISSNTTGTAGHPNTYVSTNGGYTLIGGGAKVNWSGWGNLLTKSIPSGNSWLVGSKDHIESSPASITAYAIGIQPNIPNFGALEILQESASTYASGSQGVVTVNIDNTWVVASAGAEAQYAGLGRLLVGILPNVRSVTAISHDHLEFDGGTTYAYAVKIRKKP
ncbi:hypothetical protein [Chitinophaga nivalis]|uniref:Uncharacterized protein n=1 Tax=Chitinophaga nivalis TaxID=2991709 RepID=A0ABT3IRE0_9BACT|nr:hypothetical protein [Chitinophaga nivalis]MCW3463869.1 hypothetical protein [Chitinophaga nivalis]MCW3486441.1 hypothetical protein [Chitinophaga nivalis]